ncbi:MAG TPA: radical SAM protein [Candidatus Paceibacterota bacterium]|nr:radical SAM protein [Candidatus Paceibacterota bacterium]
MNYDYNDPKVAVLRGGIRPWWDVVEKRFVQAATLYLPQGCPDWGELQGPGKPILCRFCSLPHAAAGYRQEFFGGRILTAKEYLEMFRTNLECMAPPNGCIHTAMVFNAGSFLAESANPVEVQTGIARMIAEHPTIVRLVIEARAVLITAPALRRITDILQPAGKLLTIRIGVETQDDYLRLKMLRKGHTRQHLLEAVQAMRETGVNSGGYVLLNPAPGLSISRAIEETERTVEWVLGIGEGDLDMDEAYFGPTCVGPGTLLEAEWSAGKFRPASLWATWKVLRRAAQAHGRRVHLLPFKDEPPFLAVPSNHLPAGIPENLEGAQGCDLEFHRLFQQYRETMDMSALENIPTCSCRPNWAV